MGGESLRVWSFRFRVQNGDVGAKTTYYFVYLVDLVIWVCLVPVRQEIKGVGDALKLFNISSPSQQCVDACMRKRPMEAKQIQTSLGQTRWKREDRVAWRGRTTSFERRRPFPDSLSLLARRSCFARRTAGPARSSFLHIPDSHPAV